MFKIQISDTIIEDSDLSNHGFYLYTYLKLYAYGRDEVFIHTEQLLQLLKWKDKKTLKRYLQELRARKYIVYELETNKHGTESLPICKPLVIKFNENYISDKFTQITDETISQIQDIAQFTEVYKLQDKEYVITNVLDQKESATRICYILEQQFIKKHQYALAISYSELSEITKCSNKTIKSISILFQKHKLISVITGNKKDGTNKRFKNRYMTLWNKESDEKIDEKNDS